MASRVGSIRRAAEPVLDKLSALIVAMNEKYGADLGDADKVWVDQQWVVVKDDEEMRTVALNNDRSQCELVLAERTKQLLVDRHEGQRAPVRHVRRQPRLRSMILSYLGGTHDEFLVEAAG